MIFVIMLVAMVSSKGKGGGGGGGGGSSGSSGAASSSATATTSKQDITSNITGITKHKHADNKCKMTKIPKHSVGVCIIFLTPPFICLFLFLISVTYKKWK